jgi:peptidoglycan hydrolase CwlO-like protein
MEKLFITSKRKSSHGSDSEPSSEDKRLKESNSPAKISSDEDEVMEVLGPKIDLLLSKLSNLETKMVELNVAVKGLQSKVTSLEIEVDSVKTKQKVLDDNFTSLEKNTVFVDEQVQELIAKTYKKQ